MLQYVQIDCVCPRVIFSVFKEPESGANRGFQGCSKALLGPLHKGVFILYNKKKIISEVLL